MKKTKLVVQSDFLWFLILTYTMIMVMANWFDARLVKIANLVTDAGTIIFPLTFLLSDLITEVYGFKYARRAIWCGFIFNVIFLLYGQLIIHLPSPDYATQNNVFDTLLTINTRIIFASIISYFISETVNSFILARLKVAWNGRYMGGRFVISTFFASLLDSIIFSFIAFYNILNQQHLIMLVVTMWVIKTSTEIIGLPISIYLANKLKRIEKIDMYDEKTDFNLFSLDTTYPEIDNKYFIHH